MKTNNATLEPRPARAWTRLVAAALCGLLALGPWAPALAAPEGKRTTSVLAVQYVALPGALEGSAARLWAQVLAELRTRPELKITEPSADPGDLAFSAAHQRSEAEKASAQAREQQAKAAELSKKGKASQAAAALGKAVSLLLSHPLALDQDGGALLAELTQRMAAARMMSGNDEGGDEALADLVRRAPDRALAGDYPPAFVRAFESARQRVLSSPRGSLRILAPLGGSGGARVLLDGRPLGTAPVHLIEVPTGIHVVRVERGGEAWAQTETLLSGAELLLQPRLGISSGGPAAELSSELGRGQLDRPTAVKAAHLAKAAGAQAALVGAVARENDGLAARSFLVLVKGERVIPLSPMALDAEMLGASLEVLRLADDLVARLAVPPPEPPLPMTLGTASAEALEMPAVSAAPAAAEGPASPMAVSSADLAKAAGVAGPAAPSAIAAPAGPAPASAAPAAAAPATAAAVNPAAVNPAAVNPAAAPAGSSATPAKSSEAPAAESEPAARRVALPGARPPAAAIAPAPAKAPLATEESKEPVPAAAASEGSKSAAEGTAARAVVRPGAPASALAAPAVPAAAAAPAAPATAPAGATSAVPKPEPSKALAPLQPGSINAATMAAATPESLPPRDLVIPRRPTRDDDTDLAPAPATARGAPVAATRMEAREASEVALVRESQPAKSHTVLWIIAGVIVAGGLGTGGFFLYQSTRTASSATVTASWGH